MKRILVDFHHSSLLRSLIYTLEDRNKIKVYRPIGMQWFIEGFWKINDNWDTAQQYLALDQVPKDNTPKLNRPIDRKKGVYYCYDGGSDKLVNRSCSLEFFKHYNFDYVLCSIPSHIEPFERLIRMYKPKAKLIVQIGNEWPSGLFEGHNVLASVKPREIENANVMFYHQEFSTKIFRPNFLPREKIIYSFVNVLEEKPRDYKLFLELEKLMPSWKFKIYGGQNRDGNLDGPEELSEKMRECAFAFHCKTGGDGYGHILWNNAFSATPVITRYSDYSGKLGETILNSNTAIFVDGRSPREIASEIELRYKEANQMGQNIYNKATEVCDFEKEAEEIGEWIRSL